MPYMAEVKTQAVGAIGAALLAGGGVTVAVGIYEAQEHHSAVGWFTCCAACFITAILIPVITFMFLPWVEYLGTKQARTLSVASATPENKISPKKENDPHPTSMLLGDRTFIKVTPRFLAETHKSHKTEIEAEAALQRYMGKWMQVSGILDNMYYGGGPNGKETLFVRLVENDVPTAEPRNIDDILKRLQGVKATLIFTDKKWIDEITTFSHADKIFAIGKLSSVDSDSVTLVNCELIKNQATI